MLFSSITFLYVFLPCVVVLYYLVPGAWKNAVLLAASLIFYGWGEPRFLGIMAVEIMAGYSFGLLIEKYKDRAPSKFLLGASLVVNVVILGYFKYADFLIENIGHLTGTPVKLLNLALPIGISFYTFQLMSYTIDVYRGEAQAQRNPFALAAYVAMFPQLIAGPIVRYVDIDAQLSRRTHSFAQASLGARRFILGLAKKVLIANALGSLCSEFHNSTDISVLYYWLNAISFTLQIYFDFSGYSDMAIGLGKIFGFEFKENFNYPYISESITEFWRRWHMSLGSWFRDYIYIPLGGNRVSRFKWIRNIVIVWFLTGLWHGAAWNFVLWGMFFAVLLVLEKLWLGKHGKNHETKRSCRGLSHLYVLILVVISFVIFDAESFGQAAGSLMAMFGLAQGLPLVSAECIYYLRSYGIVLVLAVIGATPLPRRLANHVMDRSEAAMLEPVLLLVLLLGITAYLIDGSFNPFLYFRF